MNIRKKDNTRKKEWEEVIYSRFEKNSSKRKTVCFISLQTDMDMLVSRTLNAKVFISFGFLNSNTKR
jgi:hypothetical protein